MTEEIPTSDEFQRRLMDKANPSALEQDLLTALERREEQVQELMVEPTVACVRCEDNRLPPNEAYRCFVCGSWFCHHHAGQHFELADPTACLESLREERDEALEALRLFANLENWIPGVDIGRFGKEEEVILWDGESLGVERPWEAARDVLASVDTDQEDQDAE